MSNYSLQLEDKIKSRQVRVCVVGLGYVGLPLAVECLNTGYKVDGFDVSERKVKTLLNGESDVDDIPSEVVAKYIENGMFRPGTNPEVIKDADIVPICVPTPLNKTKDPDMSFILSAVDEIKKNLSPGTLIVLESTTYPGTTDELIKPQLEAAGFTDGDEIFVAFSPERVDPGNPIYQTKNTPKVIGADNENSRLVATAFYESILDKVITVSSSKAAEMVKLLENTFRSVNIGLVNEIALMCERLDLNIWEVIDAASSKPFGFMPFYPGPGLGGHCIPIDPHYLSWKLRSLNYYARFIELAGDINSNMPRYVVYRIMEALNDKGRTLKGAKVVLLGLAYKRDISDLRESPALDVMELLEEKGAEVVFHDPYVPSLIWVDDERHSVPLNEKLLEEADIVVLTTDHNSFDYQWIYDHSPLIYDTRNAFKHIDDKEHKLYCIGT